MTDCSQKQNIDKLFQKYVQMPFRIGVWGDSYGYGWLVEEKDGHQLVSHGGGMLGYRSALRLDPGAGVGAVVLSTMPVTDPGGMSLTLLEAWRGLVEGSDDWESALQPTPLPEPIDPARYSGTYTSPDGELSISLDGERLRIENNGTVAPMEHLGGDRFVSRHPSFDRFVLRFDQDASQVVHGERRFTRQGVADEPAPSYPDRWLDFVGHYRSHNPWRTNFRIIIRDGKLLLVEPSSSGEKVLVPLQGNEFRIDEHESPERLRFDQIAGGQALRANLSGCDFYRFFTP